MLQLLILLGVLLGTIPAFGISSTHNSCQILIHFEKVNGEEQDIQFFSPLKSKDQCKTLAQFHRINFDPQQFRSKRVTFIWKQKKKTIPFIAQAKKKIAKVGKKKKGRRL